MTVLIIGGSGFLGTELVRQAAATGHETAATFASRPGSASGVAWHSLDVRDPERVARLIADIAPSVVVNASSGQSDWAVTADGAVRVALASAEHGCRLVHVSSDAVFSCSPARTSATTRAACPIRSLRTAPQKPPPRRRCGCW